MSRLLSAVGFVAFAAIFGFHVLSLWRIVGHFFPTLAAVLAFLLGIVWLGGISLFLYAISRNRLKACMLGVFAYVMVILVAGTRVLDGVPDEVGTTQWRDPQQLLTPDAKYLLHNHGNVSRVLSEAEYRLRLNYVSCYFSAGFMLFAAVLCLNPLDREGQVFARRRLRRGNGFTPLSFTSRCRRCSGVVAADAAGRWPAWCPRCGATFQIG